MDFETLISHGVERDIVDALKTGFGPALLPVQERAVKQGLLAGKSLIVFAPTSSGKTAIGEMGAAKAVREGRRVFYLVPLKALAEEKYREFRARYEPLGFEIVVSTRDRGEYDFRILQGKYHLAVTTFEKLAALLGADSALRRSVGLVVVDELQMISDPDRGAALEILLTRLKGGPQIVGLSAVLERCEPLAAWLGAQMVEERKRPVELRKGVLHNGTFFFREHNSGEEGEEKFFDYVPGTSPGHDYCEELSCLAVRHFAEKLKEPTIVFVPDRKTAILQARKCAQILSLPTSEEALADLKEMEDCEAKEALTELLGNGIAFHHADLSLAYRDLVERHFRKGGIRVIFATSTLAMGVNLPAKNVIITPRRWLRNPKYNYRWTRDRLPRMDFENLAGRAARLGYGDSFGRAIVCETSKMEARIVMDLFVRAPFEPVTSALPQSRLDEPVLALVASGVDVAAFEKTTLSAAPMTPVLERLREQGLVAGSALTDLGKAVAARGMKCESGAFLLHWAREHRNPSDLEILIALATTPDAEDFYIPLQQTEWESHRYDRLMRERFHADHPKMGYELTLRVKKAFVLEEWIEERPLRDIELAHQVWSGSIERLGEDFAWLAEAFVPILGVAEWPQEAIHRVKTLAGRLRIGGREDLVPLARAKTRHVGRRALRKLADAGVTPEAIGTLGQEDLAAVVGRKTAERLHAHLHNHFVCDEPLRKAVPDGPRIVLVGKPASHARIVIEVDGVERLYSRRHFELLYAMRGKRWVNLTEMGIDVDSARKEMNRLGRRLAKELGIRALENDGQKRYRLLVDLQIDREARRHQPELMKN
jgi:helicase